MQDLAQHATALVVPDTSPPVVDGRADPYSSRNLPVQTRRENLANLLENEKSIERIIRRRSWKLLMDRCGSVEGEWVSAMSKWRTRYPSRRGNPPIGGERSISDQDVP